MKEFSRKAGRPPTPSRRVYRGTRTRPSTCERKETGDDEIGSSPYTDLSKSEVSSLSSPADPGLRTSILYVVGPDLRK